MICVLDTNILISALIKDSVTRRILVESDMKFYFPELSLHEVRKHQDLIRKKSGLSNAELEDMTARILAHVALIPEEDIQSQLPRAKAMMADIDPDDAVFVAAALARADAVVWSDDAHLSCQTVVRVLRTKEAMALFI